MNLDQIWFGLLNGTTLAFLTIYLTHLGATTQQMGLLIAAPTIANLLFTLPCGSWVAKWGSFRTVFWSAVLARTFFVAYIFLPFFFKSQTEIWVIIILQFVLNIPGTILQVSFNTLIAEAVPLEWRSYIAGSRNSLFSISSIFSLLITGMVLRGLSFPFNYQIVFTLGVVGAVMSTYHISRIKLKGQEIKFPHQKTKLVPSDARAEQPKQPIHPPYSQQWWQTQIQPARSSLQTMFKGLRIDSLKGKFGRILLLVFLLHTFQLSLSAIYPIYAVNNMHLSDQALSIASGITYTVFFFSSTQLVRLARRLNNQKITALGVMILSLYPFGMPFATSVLGFWALSLFAGLGWSFVAGGLLNYLLENTPTELAAANMAWYNLVFNAAFLFGSMTAPIVADWIGLTPMLMVLGAGRILAGVLIWFWG